MVATSLLFNFVLEVLTGRIRKKKIKSDHNWKKRK